MPVIIMYWLVLLLLLQIQPPKTSRRHPLEHVGVYVLEHMHPSLLSVPEEHCRTYSLTHLHPCNR